MSVGRFAPSPTGALHLGNLRTALVAWLWARHHRGDFHIRMEDLDPVVSKPEHEAGQLRDLQAIGLDWDGNVVRQSERTDHYRSAIARLGENGLVYRCYCTRREVLEAASASHHSSPDLYPGTCRDMSDATRAAHEASGRPFALRLRADRLDVEFTDERLGSVRGVVDDVVIQRNDGVPAYNLAVVVDDAAQNVDLVVRGDDLVSSTPSQIAIARFLDLPVPRYAHIPLMLGPSGARLAKRDGAVTLADRQTMGDIVATVVGFLAGSIGLGYDPTTAHELVDRFDPSQLSTEPSAMTEEQIRRPLP